MLRFLSLLAFGIARANAGEPYNTFDGPGFAACKEVAKVHTPTTVDEMVAIVKNASANGTPVRASGVGHMWYDTLCSDDPQTEIIKTDGVAGISDLQLTGDTGSVLIEAGVTFLELADWLHARGASIGYTLVNWNITIAGAIATGSHRSSLNQQAMVPGAALALDIIDGQGNLRHLEKDESNDTWLAATTSLGLMGVIARVKFQVLKDFKVHANQTILDEDDVLNGDIYAQISPYVTANYWWWPGQKKFHLRTYNPMPMSDPGESFQNTFSLDPVSAATAKTLLDAGQNSSTANFFSEGIFFGIWSAPNFRDKRTQLPILSWPTTGFAYDILIGGLYPEQKPEWEYGLHGYTLELAVPVTMANQLLKRVRQLFDEAAAPGGGGAVTSTYRSGINIKFGVPFPSLLGQTVPSSVKGADWSKGAIMFDFPSYHPSTGDHTRFNQPFYHKLAKAILDEFPARPHWTKNTREVFQQALQNFDPDHLRRFAAVRKEFDPQGTFKSIVGEIIGVMN